MKPLIGLVPLVDEERDSYWMLPGYMDGVAAAGGIPVVLPLTADEETLAQLAEQCDGFLFTGGHDVSPALYGQEPLPVCGACCAERDAMERVLLEKALAADKAVLGICRGIQFLNAALGGTLYQDLPTQAPSKTEHHQKPPYHLPVHSVTLVKGAPLQRLLDKERLAVNSYHHQAVRDLSSHLQPMAYAEDGLVEAVYAPAHTFVWAVQWHPEFSWAVDADSRKIFAAFVNACR